VKSTLVWLLLGCASVSSTQVSPTSSRDSVEAQRLLKFSGKLTGSPHGGYIGSVTVRFRLYNESDGGEASWEETQSLRPDAQERYTVLLGETTLGGLPQEIFASHERHWLGVQPLGQPEQARLLLVELPSAWKPDPVASNPTPVKKALLPTDPTERQLALILVCMFLLGTALACGELVKWWRRRAEQFGEPPFANLLNSIPSADGLRRAAQTLRFPLSNSLRTMPRALQESESIPIVGDDQPKKVA
jgi:hypothetical protein